MKRDRLWPELQRRVEHLLWHRQHVHHWHVGATALDDSGTQTEDVRELMGYPVYRLCELGRDEIIAVPRGEESCHR